MAIGAGPEWMGPATAATATRAAQNRKPAPAPPKAPAAPPADDKLAPTPGPAAVKSGSYWCATFSGGRLVQQPGLSRDITGGSSYRDSDGKTGSFTYDRATTTITFRGGSLDGTRALYQEQGRPMMKLLNGARYANVDCDLQ